ncbi:MAG: aminopeptidase N [Arenicellales bacterium]|nr:aminopeptidase N [Arenicellales bacterium]
MAKKPIIYLKNYQPPDFFIDTVELEFILAEETTRVRNRLLLRRNGDHSRPLVLDGEGLELNSLKVNDELVQPNAWSVSGDKLILPISLDKFVVETDVSIHPQDNTTLSGLYCSSGNFCTQCEAEGFRRITYFVDRPDVLSRYKTTIIADRNKYPVLLSNGNLVAQSDMKNGLHRAVWEDPFPKPSYLFALVAGDLSYLHDEFTTCSGRKVDLYIYTQHHNVDKCGHAMTSLKKSMRWDELVYGRECDLDRYMIVAVDDFNMGAMENKGLNIFNSKYVLAKPETATDADYEAIEGVIAHEYFHNWSGNRVTCRDWFQLSLKEGFTVFRDQEFSADMGSRGVKRIQDVNVIREHQFLEDTGPLAHPVRPKSYKEINNFYTVTVYNKGAEVVRMLQQLVGVEGFRRGTDHYFKTFDGQAVTTDDFVDSIESQNDIDLKQFKRWYDQAGTPQLELEHHYSADNKTYTLQVQQSCPPTPRQKNKKPFYIPLKIALLDPKGEHLDLSASGLKEEVLHVRKRKECFVYKGISSPPVLSALRGFSAPVKVNVNYDDKDLYFLMVHDTDPFSRWDAAQRVSTNLILALAGEPHAQRQTIEPRFVEAIRSLLQSDETDRAMLAQLLKLPAETYVSEFMKVIDPESIHQARSYLKKTLGQMLWDEFLTVYRRYENDLYEISAESIGRRRLKNICLDYLLTTDTPAARKLAVQQFAAADNMTDTVAALTALNDSPSSDRDKLMAEFYSKWKNDNLVVDKWLSLHATSHLPATLDQVENLTNHESFNIHNPNRIRALIGAFAQGNAVRFHDVSGRGYRFVSDYVIELDRLNPQVAARLVTVFNRWLRYDEVRQGLIQTQLQRILGQSKLSSDVEEIVTKAMVHG